MNLYFFITLKRYLEQVIMFPFVLIGKMIAMFKPLDKEYDFFMFFPIYGIGGAEKINADVVAALPDKKIIIFFTRRSPDDKLLHLFMKPNVTMKEIDKWTDNKFIYWANLVYRGICAHYINSQKVKPVVFNGQCNFAYKLFPHLLKDILKVELIHNCYKPFAWVTFPYIPFIDKRVMYVHSIIEKHKEFYAEIGLDAKYGDRILNITNTVYVPPQYQPKPRTNKLKVYYAGRGGFQKHLELAFEITRQCLNEGLDMEFHFAGTFENEIPADIRERVHWHGSISKDEDMYKLHQDMDVLFMTSRFEGFPVVIMEAMSCGVAIVATAVDGIPEHIKDGENGFMMHDMDDGKVVTDGISYLKRLSEDRQLLDIMSINNYKYAQKTYTRKVFVSAYRKAFNLPD
jgi:glycosyltransferase involved in cell wall biosynthesis